MDHDAARSFALGWIEAWNAHDLERIVAHYAANIVFFSPVAARRVGTGRVQGIPALRDYWAQGLATQPELRFELLDVLVGHECLTVLYRNHRAQTVTETFEIGADGRVVRAFACYSD